jgi:hypothetical protein
MVVGLGDDDSGSGLGGVGAGIGSDDSVF